MTAEAAAPALERYGAFLFRRRNLVFPLVMAVLVLASLAIGDGIGSRPIAYEIGLALVVVGEALRVLVVGLAYIKRGGMNKQVYAEDLVTTGMFSHCRNPLYVGNLVVAAGLLALTGSVAALLAGAVYFIIAYMAIVAAEERYLQRQFGEGYRAYCESVPRWIPRARGLIETVRSFGFDWRRVVAKEYPTMTTTVLCACAIIAARELSSADPSATLPVASAVVALLAIACALLARSFKKSTAGRAATG